MVSIRLLSCVLVLILVHLVESSAHRQVMETILGENGSRTARKALAKFKEASDSAPTSAEARKTKLKWGLDKKAVTVEGTKISEYDSIGKNSHKWLTSFTAFAADYHIPKSHPSNHN